MGHKFCNGTYVLRNMTKMYCNRSIGASDSDDKYLFMMSYNVIRRHRCLWQNGFYNDAGDVSNSMDVYAAYLHKTGVPAQDEKGTFL